MTVYYAHAQDLLVRLTNQNIIADDNLRMYLILKVEHNVNVITRDMALVYLWQVIYKKMVACHFITNT